MKKNSLLIVLFILMFCVVSVYSYAEVTDPNNYFKTLCISDQSVGFNWRDNSWVPETFTDHRYIVQKLKPAKHIKGEDIPPSGNCEIFMRKYKKFDIADRYVIDHGCYNLRKVGEEFHSYSSEMCTEWWEKENSKIYLLKVECGYYKFAPNGYFHKAFIHNSVERKMDYKNSLSLTIGKCSILPE